MKNNNSPVVSISSIKDISKINDNTKYINLDISTIGDEIIAYFIKNGKKYKYSDITNASSGYIYVNYNEFFQAEKIINKIYINMPNNLNELEIARYLYITLAKHLTFDINTDTTKCELYDLSLITNINNIWGSLSTGKANEIIANKIYYYLSIRIGLDASLMYQAESENITVKLKLANRLIMTNIFKDIPFIAANMQTKYFGTYNSSLQIDKKIKYIVNNYNDYYLEKSLKDIDYNSEYITWIILSKSQEILNINNISASSLSIIYKYIFDKYISDNNITINNLFLNDTEKSHFIVISSDNIHYSYNYKRNSFIEVSDNDLLDNLAIGKIGLYAGELIPNINYGGHLLN